MTAFRATFSDLKNIKTRQVVQLIFEIPLADFDAAYEVLGGMPNPSAERWFGIAALKSTPAKEEPPADTAKPQPVPDKPQAGAKRDWRDLPPSQRAALRGNNAPFRAFLRENYSRDWMLARDVWPEEDAAAAECIRLICGVGSRADLDKNHEARVIWHQLDSEFQAWERVGA